MILFGASGHGKVIADILLDNGESEVQFWDDSPKAEFRFPVIKTPVDTEDTDQEIIISVGINVVRKRIAERLGATVKFGSVVHTRAILGSNVSVGQGTVIMPGVVVNIDTEIGLHCIINTGATVDHDCSIASYVHVSPNATLCGNVTVGEGTHIGAGSVVIQGVKIGQWCEVGAGTVVIRDVPDFATVIGNPARILKYKRP